MLSSYTFVYDRVFLHTNPFFCEKVGNSEKSLVALKIQNGQFEKREGFGIRSRGADE
jgi:hypothetical protein